VLSTLCLAYLVLLQVLTKAGCQLLLLHKEGVGKLLLIVKELIQQQVELFDCGVLRDTELWSCSVSRLMIMLLSVRTAGSTSCLSDLQLTSLFASIRLKLYNYIGSRNYSCLLLSLSLFSPSVLRWRHCSLPGGQLSPWCQLCYTVYRKSDSVCCKVRSPSSWKACKALRKRG